MSDNIQHLDLDDDDYLDAPKALRDYVKKLQKSNQSLTTDLASTKGQLASQALNEVLSGQGFKNPKRVERDLIADGVDPLDKSAVDRWLSESGDDYAKGSTPQSETPAIPEGEQQAHEQLNLGTEFRAPADMSKIDAVTAEVPKDATGAELIEHFRKAGL